MSVPASRTRRTIALAILAAGAALVCLLRWLIDRAPADGSLSFAWPEPSYSSFRLTSIAAGVVVGSSLATSGVVLQALLRNPLASPSILGISSGAALGVIVAMYVAHPDPVGSTALPAVIGGLAALGLVLMLSRGSGLIDPVALVLIGVVVATMCGAGTMFFQHLVDQGLLNDFTRWMMGTIPEHAAPGLLAGAAAATVLGVVVTALLGRAMDAATLGDDEARTVGLRLGALRLGLFLLAGVLTALSVCLAGPIGFVGLIAPHLARLLVGPRHGALVVASAIAGAAIVVGADVARQTLDIGGGRMPVGIFTVLIGGPLFIWLLKSGRGES